MTQTSRNRDKLLAACLTVWVLAALPPAAIADNLWTQGVSAQQRKTATAFYNEGNRLYHMGDHAEAAERYRQALGYWKHPGIYYNYARVLRLLDQPLKAHNNLVKALAYGPAALEPREYQQALRAKSQLETLLVKLTLTCDEPDTEVTLNGEPLLRAPGRATRWVLPGESAIVAKKSGYLTRDETIKAEAGQRIHRHLTLVTSNQTRRWPGLWKPSWIVAATGVGVAVLGAGLWRQAGDELTEYDDRVSSACPAGCHESDLPPDIMGYRRTGEWENKIAIASLGVGGAAFVTSVLLIFLNRPQSDYYEKHESKQLVVSPLIGSDMTGLAISGSL